MKKSAPNIGREKQMKKVILETLGKSSGKYWMKINRRKKGRGRATWRRRK